ncbi:MAG: hypothetical protein IT454_16045 [Planctomycetes bacterium]|nr:hypothetical protein [Planctomycetota bacterium]
MNSNLLQTCVISAAVGCISAALTATFVGRDATSSEAAAEPSASVGTPPTAEGDSTLAMQFAALEIETRELRSRIEALELRPIADPRAEIAPAPDAASVAGSAAAAEHGGALLPSADQLQDTVVEALASIRAQEQEQASAERAERESARLEERLTRLAEQLALDRGQVNDMRALMLAQAQSRDELERLRREDADREAYRAARDQARAREQAELARILTAEQLKQYEARDDRRDGGDRRNTSGGGTSGGGTSGGGTSGGGTSGGGATGGGGRTRRGRGN